MMGWLHRFQYVYNALMAGSLDKAADGFGRLPEPHDTAWIPARDKVRRMLARAGIARDRHPARSPGPARLALRPDRRRPGQPVTVRVRRHDRPLGLRQRLRGQLRGRAGAAQADPRRRRHRPAVRGAAARPVQPDPRHRGRRDARPARG